MFKIKQTSQSNKQHSFKERSKNPS